MSSRVFARMLCLPTHGLATFSACQVSYCKFSDGEAFRQGSSRYFCVDWSAFCGNWAVHLFYSEAREITASLRPWYAGMKKRKESLRVSGRNLRHVERAKKQGVTGQIVCCGRNRECREAGCPRLRARRQGIWVLRGRISRNRISKPEARAKP